MDHSEGALHGAARPARPPLLHHQYNQNSYLNPLAPARSADRLRFLHDRLRASSRSTSTSSPPPPAKPLVKPPAKQVVKGAAGKRCSPPGLPGRSGAQWRAPPGRAQERSSEMRSRLAVQVASLFSLLSSSFFFSSLEMSGPSFCFVVMITSPRPYTKRAPLRKNFIDFRVVSRLHVFDVTFPSIHQTNLTSHLRLARIRTRCVTLSVTGRGVAMRDPTGHAAAVCGFKKIVDRGRANSTHKRQSGPDFGRGFQVKQPVAFRGNNVNPFQLLHFGSAAACVETQSKPVWKSGRSSVEEGPNTAWL